jgi:hypothetical protein
MADATPRPGPDGLIRIWLDCTFVDRLGQMRGPGQTYSDVIPRLAEVLPVPCYVLGGKRAEHGRAGPIY